MKAFTIKLLAAEMGYLAGWVRDAVEDIGDNTDGLLLTKLVITDLYRRKLEKFAFPDACSLRLTPVEALALTQWLALYHPQDPYTDLNMRSVFAKINNPLEDQLWHIQKKARAGQMLREGTTC